MMIDGVNHRATLPTEEEARDWLTVTRARGITGVLPSQRVTVRDYAGLSGLWGFVVYGAGALFFALVMIAVIDREGQPMGEPGDFQHGRDVHGHYR